MRSRANIAWKRAGSAALACVCVVSRARADAPPAPAAEATPTVPEATAESDNAAQLLLAETLYREGRRLAAEHRYDEAAAKLSESYRIDPGVGTLLALAVCHEAQGRLATAWVEFSDAMRAAQRDKREDRVQLAREHLTQIEPKLSRLTIAIAPQETGVALELRLDGVRIGPAALGVAVPIDPGHHRIDATSPGKLSFSQEVTVGPNADQRVVVIPPLKDPPPQSATLPMLPSAPTRPAPAPTLRPVPTSVYIAGIASFALVGAAIGTGVAYGEGWDNCRTDKSRCDSAERVGWINIGLSAAAAVGIGVSAYLYLTRPSVSSSSARVGVWSNPSALGLKYVSQF